MSATAVHGGIERIAGPTARLIVNIVLGVAVFFGGFVMIEPAPYDLFLVAVIGAAFVLGMRIPAAILPLIALNMLFVAGGLIAATQTPHFEDALMYVAITGFLSLSSIFFAIVIMGDMARLAVMFRAQCLATVITATLGILGYFMLPGFETFELYGRAKGAFLDPNVFGPFVVLALLYLTHGLLTKSIITMPFRAAGVAVIVLAIFLAFSRAAFLLTIFAFSIFYILLIANEYSARQRLKYISLGVLGGLFIVMILILALQNEAVRDLFTERMQLVQDYDQKRLGRFDRHILGFRLAAETPLGLGAHRFAQLYVGDPHNGFLKALVAYGWIGFVAWTGLIFWPLMAGFKLLFRPRPWQAYLQMAYAVFAGHVIIGLVIDTDHWRHFYLLMGIIWGCIGLEARWQSRNGRLVRAA